MNLKVRYKSSRKKRFARFFAFYSFFALILCFYGSFARYIAVTENSPTIEVATWKILVNGNDISGEKIITNQITLEPNGESKTTDNKLAPGQTGYFDIIINPDGTEVAIEYSISLDTTNLPEGIVLTAYEVVEDGDVGNFGNDYLITRNNCSTK